jgi:GH15 family glucan-1,4-alpha-glucosidase
MIGDEEAQDQQYPAIGSLAVIGDGRSLALLGADATVEWFCPGRFDNPPLLWRLLDSKKGGYLRVAPAEPQSTALRYLGETAVLEYEWTTSTGTARAQICMEWPAPESGQRLLWLITGVTGATEIAVDFFAQPDFGRKPTAFHPQAELVRIEAGAHQLNFQAGCPLSIANDHLCGCANVQAGETLAFSLTVATEPDMNASAVALSSIAQRVEKTRTQWHSWAANIDWQDEYRDAVIRSAIALKLLIYEPTGAVVAAGTTSLPEDIGGVRNWDYRFTWFRDAGLTLGALFSLGCEREAHRWAEWMQNITMAHGTPLRVLYTVDGELPPTEALVTNIGGYRNSLPVRTGNAADAQFQLDIYGELLECVFICDTMDSDIMTKHWEHLRQAADFIAANWQQPDHGIWEVRSQPRHFVHSKVAAWAGLQRALWLQRRHGLEGDSQRWQREARAIREEVLRHGISADGHRFARAYDDDGLDASLLLLARYGFVDGVDPLFQNTVNAIRAELAADAKDEGLLRRYSDGGDGLPGQEGAFIICSFWLVEALAIGHRQQEARALFEHLLSFQGRLGLYTEEIDPNTGDQLGNLPQAFSHIGLINAALRLTGRAPFTT